MGASKSLFRDWQRGGERGRGSLLFPASLAPLRVLAPGSTFPSPPLSLVRQPFSKQPHTDWTPTSGSTRLRALPLPCLRSLFPIETNTKQPS